jgi:hypothetical protein
MSWKRLAQCSKKECSFTVESGLIHNYPVCPQCGDSKICDVESGEIVFQVGWTIFTGKFISTSKWYKPSTWGKLRIEVK